MTLSNNIVEFPRDRIVREVTHTIAPVEPVTILTGQQIDKFLEVYIDLMCGVDSVLQQKNCFQPAEGTNVTQEELDRSYILMQQSIVAYVSRYIGDKHLFHELADATIILGETPEICMYGVATDIDDEGIPECIMFTDDDEEEE